MKIFNDLFEDMRKVIYTTIECKFYNRLDFTTSVYTSSRRDEVVIENRSILTMDTLLSIYLSTLRFCSRYDYRAKKYIKEFDKLDKKLILYKNELLIFKVRNNIVTVRFETTSNFATYKLHIDVVGFQSEKLIMALYKYINKSYNEDNITSDSIIYLVDGDGRYHKTDYTMIYDIKNIISPKINDIIQMIDKFLKNNDMYHEYGKNYKYNILLYGLPGTGKTTIVKTIASKFNIPIFFIDKFSDFETFINRYLAKLVRDNKYYILLFDDIDLILKATSFNMVLTSNQEKEEKYEVNERKLYELLQYLDGFIPYKNTINIMTTNHPELLDERLLRPGRVDQKIEVDNLSYDYAIKFCEKFKIKGKDAEKLLESFSELHEIKNKDAYAFNPSELENYILSKLEV